MRITIADIVASTISCVIHRSNVGQRQTRGRDDPMGTVTVTASLYRRRLTLVCRAPPDPPQTGGSEARDALRRRCQRGRRRRPPERSFRKQQGSGELAGRQAGCAVRPLSERTHQMYRKWPPRSPPL
eukprot:422574-Prorocentrum_minimum.AAC.3